MNQLNSFDYDCRETAKSYVNLASVLSAFAFAGVLLIVDKKFDTNPALDLLKDKACMSFMTGFYGCLVTAFTLSVLSGEIFLKKRIYSAMLLGGGGFTLSGTFLFWGIVCLMQIYVSPQIVGISKLIFVFTAFFGVIFLSFGSLDVIMQSNIKKRRLTKDNKGFNLYIKILAYSLSPLILACFVRFLYGYNQDLLDMLFKSLVLILLIFITIGGLSTIITLNSDEDFELSQKQNIVWLFIHSLILGLMVIILP